MKIKNPYPDGDPNREVFTDGVMAERERLKSILQAYHKQFGTGDIEDSATVMEIRHLYNFVIEARQP